MEKLRYKEDEQFKIIFKNFLLMLYRRNIFDKDEVTDLYNNNIEKLLDNMEMNELVLEINTKKIQLYILNNKISSLNTSIINFLENNEELGTYKFILVQEYNKKFLSQIKDYNNVELFFLYEFKEDIISKIFIPKHTLLNDEEKNEILSIYNKNELPKLGDTDKMVRYYGGKVGDVFRIERNEVICGTYTTYRYVINGDLDILFI